jgi:hypothetical protein
VCWPSAAARAGEEGAVVLRALARPAERPWRGGLSQRAPSHAAPRAICSRSLVVLARRAGVVGVAGRYGRGGSYRREAILRGAGLSSRRPRATLAVLGYAQFYIFPAVSTAAVQPCPLDWAYGGVVVGGHFQRPPTTNSALAEYPDFVYTASARPLRRDRQRHRRARLPWNARCDHVRSFTKGFHEPPALASAMQGSRELDGLWRLGDGHLSAQIGLAVPTDSKCSHQQSRSTYEWDRHSVRF